MPADIQPADLSLGADLGEYLTIAPDPDAIQIEDAGDGGAFVAMPGERDESAPPDPEFYSNLAAVLPDQVKDRIVTDLLQRIEEDREARKLRDQQYEEGIRRTGLGNDAPGGAEFDGASRVVHPMLTEACIDYESRIIKELFPPSGPVKPNIIGTVTPEKEEKARRKTEHMNWQIKTQIKEARSVLETTLTQTPLGGSQFIRQFWDHRLKRPRWEFAAIDKIYVPFSAADFVSAHRKTYADRITAVEFKQRVGAGMYLDIEIPAPAQVPDPTKAESASHKVEGVEDPSMNLDGARDIYEVQAYLEVTDDAAAVLDREQAGELYPYLITIDAQSRKMLAMYRDWEDGDEAREPIEHLFEFPFIPWRGAYSIGFPQLIGGLSAAATGALRALLDSAHISNAPGGLILKGSGVGGQTRRPEIGEFTEIEGGLEADDIRKRVMPFSISQPSAVLFQLLGFLVDAGKGVVRTTLDEAAVDSATPVPVGTQMSRVEEGLTVFSAIHARAHAAFNRLLAGLHRLNRLYLPEQLRVTADGTEIMVRRRDYEGPCDVQGVSDPTIYSDQQRFAQLNYIQSRAAMAPQLYKQREVELAGLRLIKWPDPESLLQDIPQPHELNAVNENLAMALGRPVQVFPEQDHLAHLQVLLDFMKSPALGSNPILAPHFLPAALKHAAEHIAYYYVAHTVQTVTAAAKMPAAQLMSNDPALKVKFDQLLAQASQRVVPDIQQAVSGALPLLQQAMQMLQAMAPKPPMDPALAATQAAQAETARKAAADQTGNALKQQANQIDAERVQVQREGQVLQAQTKLQTTAADNEVAREVAEDRLATGQPSHYVNGESLIGQ